MTGGIVVLTSSFISFSISTAKWRLFKVRKITGIHNVKKIISSFSITCVDVL